MSRQAIAAVLARTDLASGERLVALSLASFAGRENRAWPGAPAASARAGLSRSRYQHAREQLVARGLVAVDERVTGRGRASILTLLFADVGPWWDGEINVELFEAVLTHSPVRGPERLLLATMAALADERGDVCDLSTEQLCAAAGIADRTYRRARTALLESGRLDLVSGAGGRGNTNVWTVRDPRGGGDELAARTPRRVAPPADARPLVASASSPHAQEQASGAEEKGGHDRTVSLEKCPALTGVSDAKGGHDRTVSPKKCPVVTGVSATKGGQDQTVSPQKCPVMTGVSDEKGGHDRTVSPENCPVLTGVSAPKGGPDQTLFELAPLETPAETPAKTPAANARAGKEPQNPRTKDPPNPPEGGSSRASILVDETYFTERGRKRHRTVRVDLDDIRRELGLPGVADRSDWEQIRKRLRELVGNSTFEIWLEPLELIAVDPIGSLVIAAPAATRGWIEKRFARVLARCGEQLGRSLRFAEEPERHAFGRQDRTRSSTVRAVHINQLEVS